MVKVVVEVVVVVVVVVLPTLLLWIMMTIATTVHLFITAVLTRCFYFMNRNHNVYDHSRFINTYGCKSAKYK